MSESVRAAARLIVDEALEEEVTDTLGRKFYRHGRGLEVAIATGTGRGA